MRYLLLSQFSKFLKQKDKLIKKITVLLFSSFCVHAIYFLFSNFFSLDINAYLSEFYNGKIHLGCQWAESEREREMDKKRNGHWIEHLSRADRSSEWSVSLIGICIHIYLFFIFFIHAESFVRSIENKTGECQRFFSTTTATRTKEWHQLLWF